MTGHRISLTEVLEQVLKKLNQRESRDLRLATLDALVGELFLLRGRIVSGEWPLQSK